MKEQLEMILNRAAARLLLLGALGALVVAVAITFSAREPAGGTTASANSPAAPAPAPAAAPAAAAFIKFDGIDGEATDDQHQQWIEVLSVSQTILGGAISSTTRTSSRASIQDLSITKRVDKSTPLLMLKSLKGEHIPSVEFDIVSTGRDGQTQTYLRYILTDVLISNYSMSGSTSGDDRLIENVTLNFAKFEVIYTPQDTKGATGGKADMTWDISANREG